MGFFSDVCIVIMENFIPFIIGIAFFVYKTWVNFQAEQNKAKKRNPSAPVAPSPVKQKSNSVYPPSSRQVSTKTPEPFLIEETFDPNNPYEPKYKHLYQREKSASKTSVEKRTKEDRPAQRISIEGYNPEQVSDEVKHNRTIHQKHNHNKKVQEEEASEYHFDMRDAIIKEAILNRPQF